MARRPLHRRAFSRAAVSPKVIRLLHDQGLLSQDRLELLDSWKTGHTGFSAHIESPYRPRTRTGSSDWLAEGAIASLRVFS